MDLRRPVMLGLLLAVAAGATAQAETPRTLTQALAAAYANNPGLQAARAQLRAVDENVPQALAGWRPQVTLSANAGYNEVTTITHYTSTYAAPYDTSTNRLLGTNTEQLTVVQPLWRGGATRAATNRARNQVLSQRAQLMSTEQQLFLNVISAFVNVIASQQVLALDVNNERVLAKQLQATRDRFRVGEITETDVAQAEAALAGATATRQTAEGSLQTARGQFLQYVGELPGHLVPPQPVLLPVRTLEQARALASVNNPNVIAARFNEAAAKDAFDAAYAKLMPSLSLQGVLARTKDVNTANTTQRYGEILATLTMPLYQGGAEYAAIRQARQQVEQAQKLVLDAQRSAVQLVISAWETYNSAKSTLDSTRAQIRSNEIALEGTEREAIVGTRTTLDVLNAEQLLLNSQVALVQNLANLVGASYAVAGAVGRLTARDLALPVPHYDETAYYNAVKNRLIGTGDYATDQPGR